MSAPPATTNATPSYIRSHVPLQALCRHYRLQATPVDPSGIVGDCHDMAIAEDVRTYYPPTHVLAVTQVDMPSVPLMIPINANMFQTGFRYELTLPPSAATPVPRIVDTNTDPVISLPVVPVVVPHPSSLSLILLYGLGLETDTHPLSLALLPGSVVGEFPNAAAMATVLASIPRDSFDRIYRHNQGIWKNVLALGMRNQRIVELVSIVWNVTAEARRIRNRTRQQ
ncbi:hypothetical protein D9619_009777 [Psilocybe cf. subviscida]|uniref:Uncharacterized protein n=1 Tax=Psilocybe cf. subviscida TaxID=2480587 RepID=A0A8H5BN21_9AGAR|nr:hypothetical protein D9619_009777 [Psilocybe cf. subviscida]